MDAALSFERHAMIASAQTLIDRAKAATGLSDFGPEIWREGLDRQLAAAALDVAPDALARVEAIFVDRLVKRLRIEEWHAANNQNASAPPIEGPLIIVGTGRSGTTAAHYLLSMDPQFRILRKWEAEDPAPPPNIATEHNDPRRPRQVASNVQHITAIDGPTEDRKIQEYSFHDDAGPLGLHSYRKYWSETDHSEAFPYHERFLRMLHSSRPPYRWLLKSPDYLHYLKAVADYYPNALFVMTHRDPASVVPSACSVIVESTRLRLPDWTYDPVAFGQRTLNHLAQAAVRSTHARKLIGQHRFLDVGQAEVHGDAVGMAERIYDFAGLKLESSVRDAIDKFSRENAAGSRGEHKYSAEDFGLTKKGIRAAFSDYLDEYSAYCNLKPI
jgi:hypothetical protein